LSEEQIPQVVVFSRKLSEKEEQKGRVFVRPRQVRCCFRLPDRDRMIFYQPTDGGKVFLATGPLSAWRQDFWAHHCTIGSPANSLVEPTQSGNGLCSIGRFCWFQGYRTNRVDQTPASSSGRVRLSETQRWMMFSQHANEMFFADVCVTLSRRNRTMAQELLHDTNIYAVSQKQRRYRVAEHVRGYMSFNSSVLPHSSKDF
jgi:hypothetical protein